jgi:hypothetical protein
MRGRDEISTMLIGPDSVKLEYNCPNHTFQVLLILAESNSSVVATPDHILLMLTFGIVIIYEI